MQFGVNRFTGKRLTGLDHLKQSLVDILSTPTGTRIMRRQYGSDLWKIVDSPMNAVFVSNFIALSVLAIYRWEPRVQILRFKPDFSEWDQGTAAFDATFLYKPEGRVITLDGVILNGLK